MLQTEADADSSVNLPTISTSASGKKWTAQVDTVPAQKGGDDETVLSPGPWSIVAPKDEVGTKFGLAACTGADDSTFSALGKPSTMRFTRPIAATKIIMWQMTKSHLNKRW